MDLRQTKPARLSADSLRELVLARDKKSAQALERLRREHAVA